MLGQEYRGFVAANGLQFYVERAGEGPTLFYISGTGGDLRNKPNQLDSPLAKHFNLMCFDQRGLGQSAKPAVEYTMADYADDAAALLDQVTDAPVRVIGVSYGGMVAQELALRYPEKIRSLLLVCTSAGGAGDLSSVGSLRRPDGRPAVFPVFAGASVGGSKPCCFDVAFAMAL